MLHLLDFLRVVVTIRDRPIEWELQGIRAREIPAGSKYSKGKRTEPVTPSFLVLQYVVYGVQSDLRGTIIFFPVVSFLGFSPLSCLQPPPGGGSGE